MGRLRSFIMGVSPNLALLVLSSSVLGQISTVGSLTGTVADPKGAVVRGADVLVKNNGTGALFGAVTVTNGTFFVPALNPGTYTVTISAPGFKQAIVRDVKVDAGTPATVNIMLEVGTQVESVVVEGVGEVLQAQSANVSTTITGRQITELPFTSRDALDLVLLLPGTTTPGRPRTSTINGLPKGAINITLDGVNVQDNILKSSDGYFTYIRPRIDAINEVTVSTATPGAESSAEGAVQVKFVTRSGDNAFHGGVYEYHRNPALHANYWFNNRDLPPDPRTGKAPRDRVLLNQYGFRLGGPFRFPKKLFGPLGFDGRDRAFFFVNYEEYRLPEQTTRQRTILHPLTQEGIFRYNTSSGVRQVDLLQVARTVGCGGCTTAIDPTIAKLLGDIRQSTSKAGAIQQLTDPNLQRFTFTNTGGQDRYFPTVRFDFNLTSKHHLESIYNYQKFGGKVDFLNNADPAFPGFPNHGSQISNRFSEVIALRSTLTPTMVNEARFGFTGGTLLFFPETSVADFSGSVANQQGLNLNGISAAGITGPNVVTAPSRRNAPVWQINDTINWTRGTHSLSFGGSFTQINLWSQNQTLVPSVTFGIDSTDPASAMFVTANFPGASAADISRAAGIYAVLTGHITAISANARLDEKTGQYSYLGGLTQRAREREAGLFAQDSWRMRPSLTLTGGLRWEVQFPFTALNNVYAQVSYNDLFGVSGPGNLFKPGTLSGQPSQYTQFKAGSRTYQTDYNNFAPSIGFAWSPNWRSGVFKRLFGGGGQTVLRGGYSVAYNREGINLITSILGGNPGGTITVNRNLTLGNLGTLPVLLRETNRLGAPAFPSAPTYPGTGLVTDAVNAFNPHLQLGYVQSWTIGLQREINRDTAVEVRYVANRGVKLWQQYDLNETNIIENGFLNEFRLAQANLQANIAAGRGANFRYFGAGTGTSPLPIILRHFSGAVDPNNATNYGSANFASATFVNPLAIFGPAPFAFANSLIGNATFRTNAAAAGLPINFFRVNPGKLGGAFTVENNGRSYYDAAVVELRRRLSRGLLVQASYAFSRALTNMPASSSAVVYQPATLRDLGLSKTLSPFGVTHAFKANWIHELPIGRGKMLAGNVGPVLDRLIGGWEWHGTARIQSGSPNNFGNVRLVGMTRNELQKSIRMRFDDAAAIAYYLPQDIIDNTIRAFNVSATSATGYGALGPPTGRYIAPASGRDCIEAFTGQCGTTNLVLYGPSFARFDLSAVKRIKITETVNFEFRAEFLNAFNNINFLIGSPANDVSNISGFSSTTFGQTTNAYRDISTTNDPGGRLIQFVGRINF